MFDRLHIFDVILQAHQVVETEHREHVHRGFLFANELCFHTFQSEMPCDIDDFADESLWPNRCRGMCGIGPAH